MPAPGTFNPATGTYTESTSDDNGSINISKLPLDSQIGDWPMTNYAQVTDIDKNPGIPSASKSTFSYPLNPAEILLLPAFQEVQ